MIQTNSLISPAKEIAELKKINESVKAPEPKINIIPELIEQQNSDTFIDSNSLLDLDHLSTPILNTASENYILNSNDVNSHTSLPSTSNCNNISLENKLRMLVSKYHV